MSSTSAEDPAVRATHELNHFFAQMEISCHVEHTEARGKYVVATADVAAGTELVEELPMVSWPSSDLITSALPFCFQCLRLKSHRAQPCADNDDDKATQNADKSLSWSDCAQCKSRFCSDACRQLASRTHRLLCASLPALRHPAVDEATAAAAKPKTASSAVEEEAGSGGITREALARCVVWLVTRMAGAIERQGLTYDVLQADYAAQKAEEEEQTLAEKDKSTTHALQTSCALVSQLFTQTAAPFNRLIAPPDSTVFARVDKTAWFAETQGPIAKRAVALLRLAAGGAPQGGDDDAADWAAAVVEAAVRDDTLTTLLGQLNLNAHGVNDYILLDVSDKAMGSSIPFTWMLKGAAVFTLLSAFNHACCPNVSVTFVDGTHEICLKTTEAVKKGEELCITYIPIHADSTRAERQAQLKHYLFQCRCPLCTAGP